MQSNNQSLSLANLDFGDKSITVYGTQMDPLIKCSDLLIHVLGYGKCHKANWYKDVILDQDLVVKIEGLDSSPQAFFTEMGIYTALMKSNKPIAKQFQKAVCELLKKIRLQTIEQLQQTQVQLEEAKQQYLSSKKIGFIYAFEHKKYETIDYVGLTEKSLQQRKTSHLNTLMQSVKIPFYKCMITQVFCNYRQIELERVEYYQDQELRDRELYWQQYHGSIQQCNKLICKNCDKVYKMPKSFEKHRAKCYEVFSDESSTESEEEQSE